MTRFTATIRLEFEVNFDTEDSAERDPRTAADALGQDLLTRILAACQSIDGPAHYKSPDTLRVTALRREIENDFLSR